MACCLCGVRGLDIPCSGHIRIGSQTYGNQRSKQVTVASSMSRYESFGRLYPIPDLRKQMREDKLLDAICKGKSAAEIIEISDKIADVICDQSVKGCANVGGESEIDSAEPEALCCYDGATLSLASSLMNCSEVTERVVPIQTVQGTSVSRHILFEVEQ
jgi:hypothetical protein